MILQQLFFLVENAAPIKRRVLFVDKYSHVQLKCLQSQLTLQPSMTYLKEKIFLTLPVFQDAHFDIMENDDD